MTLILEHDIFLLDIKTLVKISVLTRNNGAVVAQNVFHYENMPMQYTEIFIVVKIKIFSKKILIVFLFLFKT